MNAPTHLRPETRRWWRAIQSRYGIEDPAGLATLTQAAEARDRAAECRETLAAEGLTVRDRWGQTKPHPLLAAVSVAEASYRGAVRLLNLDIS